MLGYSSDQGKKASELLNNAVWAQAVNQAVHEELDAVDGGVVAWQPLSASRRYFEAGA